jgi:peptidoglycan-N-acetylglucosamine deacetylase
MMIFEDPSRRRWNALLTASAVFAVSASAVALVFWLALERDATLAPLPAPAVAAAAAAAALPPDAGDAVADDPDEARPSDLALARNRRVPHWPEPLAGDEPLVTAFLVQDDPRSLARLVEVGPGLDVAFPDSMTFETGDGVIHARLDARCKTILARSGVGIMPRVSNVDAGGTWHGEAVTRLLAKPRAQLKFVENLVTHLHGCGAIGANIDIESLEPTDAGPYVDFLALLAEALHRHGMYLTVDVPLNEEQYDAEAISRVADAVVIMAYDEHFPGGAAGPIASLEWFEDGIRDAVHRIGAKKSIVAIGAYGYDWAAGKPAEVLGADEAVALAFRRHATVATSEGTVNSRFAYRDDAGAAHEVFFLDAVSAWNELEFVGGVGELARQGARPAGVGLWRLGLEDEGIWPAFLRAGTQGLEPSSVARVPSRPYPVLTGAGELFRVRGAEDGERRLGLTGRIINDAELVSDAEPAVVEKLGGTPAPLVALTFDDGPDPAYTGPLLDILKRERVPAAFFVVGSQARLHPQMLRREVEEGHLVGNHTWLHPRLDSISVERLHEELNTTQRVIESVTGRQAILFRSPYDTDSSPTDPRAAERFAEVSGLGYICVGANAGAEDYDYRATPDGIASQVLERMTGPGPFVVCLHDAGGDRSRTVAAVERLIPLVRARGLEFAGLDRIAGTTAAELNPPVTSAERLAVRGDRSFRAIAGGVGAAIVGVFMVSTVISLLRIVCLGAMIVVDRRVQRERDARAPYRGPVTVLVPAYNEGKVIRRTIDGLLASDYPALHVLVIDDGSTDDTAAVALEAAARDPRVDVLRQANAGKASALNAGFHRAQDGIVVVVDADTILLPNTVSRLVAPFADPGIDAVCGNVQVGNVRNFLTAIQDVEYVTCQNYDRRAFDALNCIGVVPGATGAWRREAVLRVGGYSVDTLTEDADLTISVLRDGGRIVYAPEARSVTEVPETFGALFRQRFRWAYGTFQTLWKHRAAFFHGTLGWIGMPNHLMFQVLFPMLAPVGDLVLVYALLTGRWNAVATGYLTFIGLDLLGSGIALWLDRRPLTALWTVFVQRFCHRQFMYVVTFAAALACLRGRRHGWNKLDRHASVEVPGRLSATG